MKNGSNKVGENVEDFLVRELELYHHGIKGQKWGIRRFQNLDGSLTAAGRKRYGEYETAASKNRTKEDWATIKEAQKWDDDQWSMKHILDGRNLIARIDLAKIKMSRIFDDVDAKNSLPLKWNKSTIEQDMAKVNPSKGNTTVSANNNCALCTMAYDMRRRGYDVIAKQRSPINILYDIGEDDVSAIYPGAKTIQAGKTADDLTKALKKEPEGSRGAAFCSWANANSGHVVAYEIKNGKPILIDAQNNEKYENIGDLFSDTRAVSYCRLDNIEPNYNLIDLAIE